MSRIARKRKLPDLVDENSSSDDGSDEEQVNIDEEINERRRSCQGWIVCFICAKLVKEKSVSEHGMKEHDFKEKPATDGTNGKSLKDYIGRCKSLLKYADHDLAKIEPPKKTGLLPRPMEPFNMNQFNDVSLSKNMFDLIKDYERRSLSSNQQRSKDMYVKSAVIVLTWFTPENNAKTFKYEHLRNLRYAGDEDSNYYLATRANTVDISKSAASNHITNFLSFLIYLDNCCIEDVAKDKSEILTMELYEMMEPFKRIASLLRYLWDKEVKKNVPLDRILILHSPLMLNFLQEFQLGHIDDFLVSSCAKSFFTSLVLTRLFILQARSTGDLLKLTVKDFETPVLKENDFVSLGITGINNSYIHLHESEYKMVSHYLKFIRPDLSKKDHKEKSLFLMSSGKCFTTTKMNLNLQLVAKVALESYSHSTLFKHQPAIKRINLAKKKRYNLGSMRVWLEYPRYCMVAMLLQITIPAAKTQVRSVTFPRLTPLQESLKEVSGLRKLFMPGTSPEIGDAMFRFVAGDELVEKLLTQELWNDIRSIFEMTAEECAEERYLMVSSIFEETNAFA